VIVRSRRAQEQGDRETAIRAGIEAGILQLLEGGTTHVGDICQSGLSVEPLLTSGLAGVVYIEVLGLDEERWQGTLAHARQLIDRHRRHERNGMRLGLTAHAGYSTHPDAFRAVTDYCLSEKLPLCVHAAESTYEVEALVHGRGLLYDLSSRLAISAPAAPGLTPVAYLADLGVLAAKPLLVHMVYVSDAELDLVAAAGGKVAHCPRSNMLLQCGRMPLEKMLARGITVALGTDSLASSPSLDVREEAKAAVELHRGIVPAETIRRLMADPSVFDA
jgi:cytosine/adenosine deaminase-related metal-dependent hydrolase